MHVSMCNVEGHVAVFMVCPYALSKMQNQNNKDENQMIWMLNIENVDVCWWIMGKVMVYVDLNNFIRYLQ